MTPPIHSAFRWLCRTGCLVALLAIPAAVRPASAQSAATATADANPAQLADRMDRLCSVLDAIDQQIPRDTFEPQAIIATTGKDPEKIFQWVRDHTYWVPYRGALRGPTGVLMDRLGNSLDRALLLADLLRAAGQPVRLMHADLSPERARDLARQARPVPKDLAAEVDGAIDPKQRAADLARLAEKFGIDPAEARLAADRATSATARMADQVTRRVADQYAALAAAVGTPAKPATATDPTPEAARDHWWVAYQKDGAWTDLDPTLPDAKPGHPFADAAATPVDLPGKLPDARYCQDVQVRVVIERWENDALHEETILTQAIRPAEAFGQRVALRTFPTDWPADLDPLTSADPARQVRDAAARQHQWVPVLAIGDQTVYQAGFTDTGMKVDKPKLGALAKTGAGVGSAAGDVAGLFGEPAPAPTPAPAGAGILTAVWIDYEIHIPDQQPRKARRQIVDLVGPAARAAGKISRPALSPTQSLDRALALVGETEILLQPCRLSRPATEHLAARNILLNRQAYVAMARAWRDNAKSVSDQLDKIVPPLGKVYALAYARGQWGGADADAYVDSPNVLTQHSLLRLKPGNTPAADGSDLLAVCAFDIVFNDLAVRPSALAAQVRMRQGIADTAAEAALAAGPDGCACADGNASSMYAAAIGRGEKWATLRGAGDEQLAHMALPDEARARIARDLADGFVVVAPAKLPTDQAGRPLAAWWRIDPTTGQTLGIAQQGWGAANAEEGLMIARLMLKGALSFKCLGGAQSGAGRAVCLGAAVAGGAGAIVGGSVGGAISLVGDIFSLFK